MALCGENVTEASQEPEFDLELNSLCNRISVLAGNQPQLLYLLTELFPGPEMTKARLPLNVAIILDHGEPVAGDFLPAIKLALKDLIDQLQPGDVFSVVAMDGEALIPAQGVEDKTSLRRQVDRIRTTNQKRLAAGLAEGLKQCTGLPERDEDVASRLVLFIGGDVDEEPEIFLRVAEKAGQQGISLIGLGYGLHWQEEFLSSLVNRNRLAQPSSEQGYIDYIASPEDVGDAFQRVCQSLHIVAQQVRLNIHLVRGVQVKQAWQVLPVVQDLGTKAAADPGVAVVTIPVGDLASSGVAYLLEVASPPRSTGPARIAQTEVTCVLPGSGVKSQTVDLVVSFAQDLGITNPLDGYVMDFVEMAQVCQLTSQAMADLEAGNRPLAAKNLRQAAAILTSQGQFDLADRIRGEADYNLRQYGRISGEGRKLIKVTSRFISQASKTTS